MRYRRVQLAGATYFFTLVTERRRPLFQEAAAVSLFLGAVQTVRARHPFEVDAYVVLPDHLHVLWTLPEAVKESFTRAYIKTHEVLDRSESRRSKGEQGIWQRRFWEHTVRDEADFARHLDYIHINPVHHGLATAPRDWPHSSFHEWVQRGVYDVTWGSDALPELPDWAKRHE